jgi:ribosome-associated protein
MKASSKTKVLTSKQIQTFVKKVLEDYKAIDIVVLDVRKLSAFTDYMIICNGTSNRHVKTLADQIVMQSKAQGVQPLGVEGEREAEWILVDLVDVVIHIMLPATREFYNLEKLWQYKDKKTTEV